jgi:hypothetical protein
MEPFSLVLVTALAFTAGTGAVAVLVEELRRRQRAAGPNTHL